MQSDFFDKKVNEAADRHHPAYDEQAWHRMEKMLDRYLPRDNNRRILFILLSFLLLGGGWLMISQPWKNTKPVAGANKTVVPAGPAKSNNPAAFNVISPEAEKIMVTTDLHLLAGKQAPVFTQSKNEVTQPAVIPVRTNSDTGNSSVSADPVNTDPSHKDWSVAKNKAPVLTDNPPAMGKKNRNDKINFPLAEIIPVKENQEKKNKKASRKANPLFFSASAGPDFSFAGDSKWGDTRISAGVGAGYTIKDRLTISTGFYSGRKIYTASPDEYNPPSQFWNYYTYLEKVDADCKVYEIPLNLSYNFGKSSRHQWFASTGISTYIMKEENYDYYYKYTPTGPTYTHKRTIKDENKHIFSVLSLSGGYKHNLSNRVFLTAAPYVKLPISGVGYGKVKLNSGGMMLTIGVKPFNAKNKVPISR